MHELLPRYQFRHRPVNLYLQSRPELVAPGHRLQHFLLLRLPQ